MNAIHFDTLAFANRLKSAGFTDAQAQVLVELQRETTDQALEQAKHDFHLDDLATKRDVKELETELQHSLALIKADTARLIAETHQHIAETKADLTRWIIAAGFLQTTVIIGVLLSS
ncbi:DUF1640 domain-containing protein [Methylocucumis oryzae]|uniref:DUF1640 domain-containing protein n=1 Tax=Methylocucumis oryzae TaxID=1632867 RepID=A0A0F3IGI7_9GAMM|nr:DUF1640 domain-containing protein [Methylocucumis oryzae]KJV05812.1 hypothetical protein VZ94_15460 [Methylocucumis oryzae]